MIVLYNMRPAFGNRHTACVNLSGRKKHTGVILAGFDPVAVDAVGSELLGHEREWVHYLTLAEGRLGSMKDIEILTA